MDSVDLFTFNIRKYNEVGWGFRKLGWARFSIDIYKIGFIFEFWAIRRRPCIKH
jgi:hypothetical protein